MVSPITKRYSEHWEQGEDPPYLVITVMIFHDTQETCLNLCWQAPIGRPMTFSHLKVNELSMNVLTKTTPLQVLAILTHESIVEACRHLLHLLGFTLTP